MKKPEYNNMKILAVLIIFSMIFSIIPVWKSELANNPKIPDYLIENGTVKLSESDTRNLCDIVGILKEPSYNLEEYKDEVSLRLGIELPELRTSNTKVFVKQDNVMTYQIYAGDIHYKNSENLWDEYNTQIINYDRIVLGTDDYYAYACEDNTISTYFKDGYTNSNSILVKSGTAQLAWEPVKMGLIDRDNNELELSKALNRRPVVKNNKIFYPATYEKTSDLFTVKLNSLKHELILESNPLLTLESPLASLLSQNQLINDLSYTGILLPSNGFELRINGYENGINEEIITDEPLKILDSDGKKIFELPSPVAYEFNDKENKIGCKYKINPLSDEIELSILTPYDWLSDPERIYPVVIDPTVKFKFSPSELTSNDTYIAYGNGLLVDKNYGNGETLIVGGQYLNDSAIIKFDISSLPDKSIASQDAILTLRTKSYTDYSSNPSDISIYNMEQDWLEGTGTRENPDTNDGATWNSPKGGSTAWVGSPGGKYADTHVGFTSVIGTDEDYEFDVEQLLSGSQGWRAKPEKNYGMFIRYENRSQFPNEIKAFHSSDSDSASYRPKLEVSFLNTPPYVKSKDRYTWNEDEDKRNTIIDLDDHFVDNDHQPLNITIWTGSEWGNKFDGSIFTAPLFNYGNPTTPDYYCPIKLKANQWGSQKIKFNATDKINFAVSEITIDIKSVNDPPILKPIGNQIAIEDTYLYLSLEAIEVEDHKIFWDTNVSDYSDPNYLDNLWLEKDPDDEFNDKKRRLVFLPDNSNVPSVNIGIYVRDEKHTPHNPSIDWENITVSVSNINDEPIITKVGYTVVIAEEEHTLTVTQNKPKLFYMQAFDEDIENGDHLTFYSDAKEEDNFTITQLTGLEVPEDFRGYNTEVIQVDYTARNSHVAGQFEVKVGVKDDEEAKDELKLKFNVVNENDPPEIKSHTPTNNAKFTNRDIINFSCVVDDPDLHLPESIYLEKLNITWLINISSVIETLGYGSTVKNQQFKAGDYQIVILVTDKEGAEARKDFKIKIEKSITLQNKLERNYKDNSTYDDIEYSYNTKTKKFIITQGKFGEIDIVRLYSYYDDDNLVIRLRFFANATDQIDFNIRIYLVKPTHFEDKPKYDVEYSESFYDKVIYKPSEDDIFGYFTEDDGNFDSLNTNEFVIEYPLADLEEGVEGIFESLKANFQIFAIIKSESIEYSGDVKIYNYRYDSIGYVSAFAPPPQSGDGGSKGATDNSLLIIAGIGIIIVLLLLTILFLLSTKKKKEDKKTVIDFSKSGPGGQVQGQQPGQIPQLFMSPFEQQFKQPPPTMPPSPGGPVMQPPPTMPTQPQPQAPPQQIPPQPPQTPPQLPKPPTQTAPPPQPSTTPTPATAPGQAPTPTTPTQQTKPQQTKPMQ